MQRSKLGKFIDNTSITLIFVIISFFFFKKFISNNIYCLILALIAGYWALKILLYFQNKKYTKLSIQKQEVSSIEKYNFELRKLPFKKQLDFFKNMLNDKNIRQAKNGLIVDNQIIIFIKLLDEQIAPKHLFECYIKTKEFIEKTNIQIKEITIICNQISQEATSYLSKFSDITFTIFSPIETYALMKKYNTFPTIENTEKTQKVHKITFIKHSFVRKQAKIFFRCSLLLYFSSLFVPYTKYYLITAAICLILSAICLCFGSKEIPLSPLSKTILLS